MKIRSHLYRETPRLVVFALVVIALGLYGSWNRELWYDEFVYFALGGLATPEAALRAIRETTSNLNQGVTGAYMFLDFILLKLFGSSTIALRLPSILAGLWMMGAGLVFLRSRGMRGWALVSWPLLLLGQVTLMYYVGEARTYMPLAAAVVGALAYWCASPESRSRLPMKTMGWISALMGASFHPYFSLYLPLILIVGWLTTSHAWHGKVRSFLNIPLLVLAGIVYLVFAQATWLQGTARLYDLDPFTFLVDPLWKSILAQVLQFVYVDRTLVVASLALASISILLSLRSQQWSQVISRIFGPAALAAGAYVAALAISGLSYSQGFWIIPRQWVASIALTSLAVIWFVFVVLSQIERIGLRRLLGMAFVGVIVVAAVGPVRQQLELVDEWTSKKSVSEQALIDLTSALSRGTFPPDVIWVRAAQFNVLDGGPVLPIFGQYYTERDWSTEFFLSD